MGRAKQMPPGLTREEQYAWVNGRMEELARSPRGGLSRDDADERLVAGAPEVEEPEVEGDTARWQVGHDNVDTRRYEGAPTPDGVTLERAPALARRRVPVLTSEPAPPPARRPASIDPDAARAASSAAGWDSAEDEATAIALQPFGRDPDAPAPPGRTPFFVGDAATHERPRSYGLPRTGAVEVAAGEPAVLSRTPSATARPAGAPEARPRLPARHLGVEASVRSATSDPYASVRALSPEVADYLAGGQGTPPPAAPQDDELLREQGRSARARLGAGLARAGAMVNEALTGTRVSKAWDGLDAEAGRPVADLLQRREDAQRQGRERRDTQRFNREEDLYRPDSQRSANARAQALLRFGPQVARIPDEEFRRMSAADVADFVKGLEHDSDSASAERRHQETLRAQAEAHRLQREDLHFRMDESRKTREALEASKRQDKLEREDEKDLSELQKRVGPEAQVLVGNLRQLDSLIGGLDNTRDVDIPGVGPIDRLKPDWMLGNDVTVRQLGQQTFNTLLAYEAGKNVTPNELERQRIAQGLTPSSTDEQYRNALRLLRERVARTLEQVGAGKNERVREQYRRNGGYLAQDARATGTYGAPRQAINPRTREAMPVESREEEEAFRSQGWIIR